MVINIKYFLKTENPGVPGGGEFTILKTTGAPGGGGFLKSSQFLKYEAVSTPVFMHKNL